ncbi:MAG: polyribonucleotide nucleotidyltransferase, partial [Alphaproteobacteria bacterium]|nr:polyribonucleotide nucleotidyltransferase [Alphaproteobacteria bacterium]
METALAISDKMERYAAKDVIKENAMERLPELFGEDAAAHKGAAADAIDALAGRVMRGNILAGKPRIDGRDNKTIRPIECEVGILPRCHGSALFTRGETQSIVSMTLGGGADALPLESI